MTRALLVLIILLPQVALATEPMPFEWPEKYRALAGHISDGLVITQITLDTIDTFKNYPERKWEAFRCQSIRLGAAMGSAEGIKLLVNRMRPDGSDDKSFFSMHTAIAFSSSGWRFSVGIPIASSVGYLRMAADKHYLTDVLTGIAAGFGAMKLCEK